MIDDIENINNFVNTLSTERFDRYLQLANGNNQQALDIYTANVLLSESLYIPLQALEITLRNSIHTCLRPVFGEFWFDSVDVIKGLYQHEQIGEAKAKLLRSKKDIVSSRVVAELPFGFWTTMFSREYDDLWQKDLHNITVLEKRKGITRKTYSGSLDIIRRLRNRVAHHECILGQEPKDRYDKIRLLIGILAPEAKHWMESHSRFAEVYEEHRGVLEPVLTEEQNETGT